MFKLLKELFLLLHTQYLKYPSSVLRAAFFGPVAPGGRGELCGKAILLKRCYGLVFCLALLSLV